MEQQFKKFLQKTKALENGTDPLSKTFEYEIFKDSSWLFSLDENELEVEQIDQETKSKKYSQESVRNEFSETNHYLKKVVFIGDSYIYRDVDHKENKEDLLGKMITAMKLTAPEFSRISFNESFEDILDLEKNLVTPTSETQDLWDQLIELKPQIVVSLGATMTNTMLGSRSKLSGIHGQFFDLNVKNASSSHQFQLFPIFHPDFLVINPNMKRTAWIDLQKVMERIGKI